MCLRRRSGRREFGPRGNVADNRLYQRRFQAAEQVDEEGGD